MFPRRYAVTSDIYVGTVYTWPSPDPEGPIIHPLAKLVTLLAATPTFRVRCGLAADDPQGSTKLIDGLGGFQRRIFYPEVDWSSFDVFPSAVIQFGPEWRAEWRSGGSSNYTHPKGTLRLILADEDRASGDMEQSCREFGIYVGQLMDDLRAQFGRSDELNADGIVQEWPPSLPPDEVITGLGTWYWSCSYLISWY